MQCFVQYELTQSGATVERIAAGLGPLKETGWLGPPWRDWLKTCGGSDLGEIRCHEDLEALPSHKALKALYLVDDAGPVIRWVVEGFQGFTKIEQLLDFEDVDREGMRDGYLYPEPDAKGHLWIRVQE
jgi:hypothetical protein